ncbi:hypothetical protein F5144DRAFT_620400 [Chaetomium tenue]|uniref:Uncharacterized protein n=1 Tax=Chaetomium tenue TaxID=1854479 RepID=A0ACB7P4Z5_9PEZI|nr:hypothetical protein F5144DRAFT_620400 [Chaetomium globosum]
MASPCKMKGALPVSEKAARELEELLVRIVAQDSLTAASDTPMTEAPSTFEGEELEKAQLERAIEESRLEASWIQLRRQYDGQREEFEIQQAIAASLMEATTTRHRRRNRGHNDEAAKVQQASEASLRATTNKRPPPREFDRHKRVKTGEFYVESYTETTTIPSYRDILLKEATNTRPHRRERDRQDRGQPQQASVASLRKTTPRPHRDRKRDRMRETTNKRPRHTREISTAATNKQTRPRHNEGHSPVIPRPSIQTTVTRTLVLPIHLAHPRPRQEARVAGDRPNATGGPTDRTQTVDPRGERTRIANPRPVQTRPVDPRPVDPRPDRTLTAGRPTERPRPVDPPPDRAPVTIHHPANRPRNADCPPNQTAGKSINHPLGIPRPAQNPIPEPKRDLEVQVPPTAAQIYRWLRTREGPRPVARCFGACPLKLVFRGLQSDNGRREPSIILGCGHVVGGKCFSDLIDFARTEGEEAPCPHCLKIPTTAAV